MEYRGVEYSVVQLPEGNRWRWEVRFGDGKTKTGVNTGKSCGAIKQAKSAIDHFLGNEVRAAFRVLMDF